MKNIIIITSFIGISFIGFNQRNIMTVTRYTPKMENQVDKSDTINDNLEYKIVKQFEGAEIERLDLDSDRRRNRNIEEKKSSKRL